jgi:hypothetical protein
MMIFPPLLHIVHIHSDLSSGAKRLKMCICTLCTLSTKIESRAEDLFLTACIPSDEKSLGEKVDTHQPLYTHSQERSECK